MSVFLEKSRSCWMEEDAASFPRLDRNISCDVAIIGSGIAGLSAAYELAKLGLTVAVFDRGPIARGMSSRTSAHLTSSLDDFYHEFIRLRGEETARLHFQSQAAAIERIGQIQEEEAIECDFARMDAYLFLAGETKPEALEREHQALDAVGLTGSRLSDAPDVNHQLSNGPCLIIPAQGRFHPLKYLDGVANVLARQHASLFADTVITQVEEDDAGVRLETEDGHRISAEFAVIATNSPIIDRLAVHAKQAPYRTYMLAAEVQPGTIDDVLYWDTEDPYHYVRLHPWGDTDLLLIGGEDHKSGLANDGEERLRRMERWARQRFSEMRDIRYRWSGQVMEPIDYAAFIGRAPGRERIFVATGDSGQGITHGVVASLLIPALIDGETHAWADVYDPSRKPAKSAGRFASESLDVAKNMAEHFTGGEIGSEDELSPGRGGILRSGLKKLAICRDEAGGMHRHSASCTHAGCVIHWNTLEQCWDCPCHGSHFAADGTALNAPAVASLQPAEK